MAAGSGAVIVATSKLDDVAGGATRRRPSARAAAGLKPEGFVLAVDAAQGRSAGRLGRRRRCAGRPLRRRQAAADDGDGPGLGDARRADEHRHLAGLPDPRPPARIPQSRQLVGRLGRGAVRPVHPRAGDLRRQLRREHPLPGRRPQPAHAHPAQGDERPDERDLPSATTRTTGSGPRPTSTSRTPPGGRRPSGARGALQGLPAAGRASSSRAATRGTTTRSSCSRS